jgi:methyl-accepting chemotaxis protein
VRIPVRLKLLGGFGVMFVLMLAIGLVGLNSLSSVGKDVRDFAGERATSAQQMGEYTTLANKLRKDQMHYLLVEGDAGHKDVGGDLAGDDESMAKLDAAFARDAENGPFARRLKTVLDKYKAKAAPFRGLANAGRISEAAAAIDNPVWDEVKAAIAAWQKSTSDQNAAHAASSADNVSAARRNIIIGLLVALVIGAALALLIARGMTRGIREILARLTMLSENCSADLRAGLLAFATGDLSHRLTPVTPRIERWPNDEIGDIAQAVNDIRDNSVASLEAYNESCEGLSGMIGAVTSSADQLSVASAQMASTSDEAGRAVQEIANAISDVARGTERQVASVGSARNRVDEVNTQTVDTASAAQQTAEAAEHTRALAQDGAQAVSEATAAMVAVREASDLTTGAIRELGEKSARIGGIVDTITTIAEQTNLLALNAAIEAARAGEQGRGFAVVAEEVRNLAEESQEAARTIAGLIGEIQDETSKVVSVVESGGQRTGQSAATVEQAREAFLRIDASVEDVTARVQAIAAGAHLIADNAARAHSDIGDIAVVAEQTSAASEQVSASTEQTAASAQEIAVSAKALAQTAEELSSLVGRFTVAV